MKGKGGKKIPFSTWHRKGVKNMQKNKYIFLQTEHFSWESPTFEEQAAEKKKNLRLLVCEFHYPFPSGNGLWPHTSVSPAALAPWELRGHWRMSALQIDCACR